MHTHVSFNLKIWKKTVYSDGIRLAGDETNKGCEGWWEILKYLSTERKAKEYVSLLLNGPRHIMINDRGKVKELSPCLDFFTAKVCPLAFKFPGFISRAWGSEALSTLQAGKVRSAYTNWA